jgi:hypothetical protein
MGGIKFSTTCGKSIKVFHRVILINPCKYNELLITCGKLLPYACGKLITFPYVILITYG